MNLKFKTYLFAICGILLVLSAILYITEWKPIPYIYAVSGAGIAVIFLSSPYNGENRRLKRLNIQQAIAALLLPVSSFLMFRHQNEWIVCLFVSAILQLYVDLVKGHEEKKQRKDT